MGAPAMRQCPEFVRRYQCDLAEGHRGEHFLRRRDEEQWDDEEWARRKALLAARREGEESMKERAAQACDNIEHYMAKTCAAAIRALKVGPR